MPKTKTSKHKYDKQSYLFAISYTPSCNKETHNTRVVATFKTYDEAEKALCKLVGLNDTSKLKDYINKDGYDSDDGEEIAHFNDTTKKTYINQISEFTLRSSGYVFPFVDASKLFKFEDYHKQCVNGHVFRINKIRNIKDVETLHDRLVSTIY